MEGVKLMWISLDDGEYVCFFFVKEWGAQIEILEQIPKSKCEEHSTIKKSEEYDWPIKCEEYEPLIGMQRQQQQQQRIRFQGVHHHWVPIGT